MRRRGRRQSRFHTMIREKRDAERRKAEQYARQWREPQVIDKDLEQLLQRCATSLNDRLERDELRPAFNREGEINALVHLLTSTEQFHPIILGKARSGKTALAHELARRIVTGAVPEPLQHLRVYEMTPSSLLAGLQYGDGWRSNVSTLFQLLSESNSILVFLRDIHTAVGGGVKRGDDEDDDLASTLEATLRDSRIRVVAESRPERWQGIAADRESFADLFTPVQLESLGEEPVADILRRAAERIFDRSKITVLPAAQAAVLDVSRRFILNQAFPGKAIELLEDALLLAQRNGLKEIGPHDVVACFSARTGLTPLLLDDTAAFKEEEVRRNFGERVLGQEPAVTAMVQKLALLKARLHDPARPMGVFLYLGPTGVGKTELAKTLAAALFGSEDRFVRFNMADYSGPYDFAVLFGQQWGDTDAAKRGKLTMALINLPFAVLLLDEFEKAHSTIFNRFLQLFDEGILVNAAGEEINLRNTLIIMTSNFGASIVQGETWGFSVREGMDAMERRVLRATEEFFSPEFINRLDGVTFFKPLSQSDMRKIAARELRKLFEREGLTRRNVQVELDDAVLDVLLKHGYSIRYGARYLKRQIEKMVTYPLSSALLSDPDRASGLLRLYVSRDHIKAAWINEDDEPLPLPSDSALAAPTTIEQASALTANLNERLTALTAALGLTQARERQAELLEEMSAPTFWDAPGAAQQQLVELGEVARRVDRCEHLLRWYDEAADLLRRVRERERRLFPELVRSLMRLERDLRFAELEMLFNDPEDWHDCIMTIEQNSGAPDGLQWVRQLVGMYTAWAETKDFTHQILDETLQGEAQSRVTLRINGAGAFGLLRHETGTHRIVEGSAEQKVVTPVLVSVWPVPSEDTPPLPEQDVEVTVGDSRGDGHFLRRLRGKARAVHLPTGLTAQITASSERTAREIALLVVQSRVINARLQRNGGADDDPWASVARSYQFTKRSVIKDPRTGVSHTNPREILAGRLDPFIEAALRGVKKSN